MIRLAVNGRFYAAPVTGVQRFAREITARLLAATEATLLLPAGARPPEPLPAGTRVVPGTLRGQAWERIELPRRVRADAFDAVLHFSPTAPVRRDRDVLVLHDLLPITHPHGFGRRFAAWYRLAVPRAARRAAVVVTASEWSRAELMRTLAVPAARIRVATQGVAPFDAPASVDAVRRVRARYCLPDRYLLAVGAGDPRKNVGFLEAMLAGWPAGREPAPPALVVVGDAPRRVHGRRGGRRPRTEPNPAAPRTDPPPADSATPRVLRLGRVDDDVLRALYTGAHALCFPSAAEGFGRPPLEAMACGSPALVADYGPAREVLGDAATILPLEPAAWRAAIAGLLAETTADRDGRIAAGMRHAAAFRWDHAVRTVLEACVDAAGQGAPHGGRAAAQVQPHGGPAAAQPVTGPGTADAAPASPPAEAGSADAAIASPPAEAGSADAAPAEAHARPPGAGAA